MKNEDKELQTIPEMGIDPMKDIETGEKVASALVSLVKKHNWTAKIQGKDYLQVEAWQTVGKFYGLTAQSSESVYVEYGQAKGFEAKAEIINPDGVIVGGASAICMNDEQNWRGKPLYQLKSMAQTRAVSKAYRLILSWVVVLAGYQPTPADEMKGVYVSKPRVPDHDKPHYAPNDGDPEWIKGDEKKVDPNLITRKQQAAIKMLQKQGKIDPKIKTTGMSKAEAHKLLDTVWGSK